MANTTPHQSFGSSEADNAVIGNHFSGNAYLHFHNGTGERPTVMLLYR
jgi:hypothetical protein